MKNLLPTLACGLLASALTVIALTRPVLADDQPPIAVDEPTTAKKTVQLVVDYGDGVRKHFHRITWHDKMTVQDATEAAAKHPRGIRIKLRGKQATAFLTQIDDLANNPRGRNWVYRVNDKLANRSFGVYPVKSGDIITWSYEVYP